MDKKIVYLLLLFVFSNCNFSKKTTGLKSNKSHPSFLETDHFGIRVKPILNREYLIFLSWYISVYGYSYPEKVISILPEKSLDPRYGSNFEIEERIKNSISSSILKGYIFNPKYIDYPLVGLSYPQIMEMQRWMSDRYNENVLIEKGFLNFNPNQRDEDCFSIETFLVGQYMGNVRKSISKRSWKKDYLPTFRLPYQYEINAIKKHSDFDLQLKEYSFGEKDFLWKWNKHFLDISPKENKIILKCPFTPIEIICENDISFLSPFIDATLRGKYLEFFSKKYLDLGNPDGTKDQYEDKYPFKEKNRFGQMEFVIVGINDENRPIIANPLKLTNDTFYENKIFRIAFNKTLENQFLPKP